MIYTIMHYTDDQGRQIQERIPHGDEGVRKFFGFIAVMIQIPGSGSVQEHHWVSLDDATTIQDAFERIEETGRIFASRRSLEITQEMQAQAVRKKILTSV